MNAEIIKHRFAYVILFIGLFIFGFLYFSAWPNKDWQRVFAAMMAGFYFFWGVLSHVKTNEINRQVLMEYFSAATLALIALLVITL